MPWPRVVAIAAAPLAAAGLVVAGVAARVGGQGEAVWMLAVGALAAALLVALGNVVAHKQPRNVVGALLAGTGVVLVGEDAFQSYHAAALASPASLPTWDVMTSLYAGQGAFTWLFVAPALLALFFPTGRLPSARWRLVAVGLPLLAAAFMFASATVPWPYQPPHQDVAKALGTSPLGAGHLNVLGSLLVLFLTGLVASAVSLGVRYRSADDVGRAQLKWFALAGLSIPATLLLCWASLLLLQTTDLVVVGLGVMFFSIPVATTIAIVRYDLYDIDRVLSTAVTWSLVTAALLGLFTGASALGGLAIGDSRAAVAVGTAACALALRPLRRKVQRWVDGRIYPLRQGTLAAIEALHRRAATGEAEPERLQGVLREALHDPGLRVGYLMPGSTGYVDASGAVVDGKDHAVPVRAGAEQVAVLVPQRRLPARLARDVADGAAVLAELVTLRLQLSRALDEAAASRTRLLHAGYAERRRLERDIHDGAQQRLVSLGMSLRLAQRHLDGLDVVGLLDETVAELGTAVAELRQIANGLRPTSLDDGLGPALAALTSRIPVPVDLEVRAGELDDAVATTAYYVAAEAVTNAVKHGDAQRITVTVEQEAESLSLQVNDDGTGGAEVRPGSGLAGLSDRVAALGGSLSVTSPARGGTIIRAVLPCRP